MTTPAWVRHYQPGVAAEIDLSTGSLTDVLERGVSEAADAVALQFRGRTTTYKRLGDQVDRAAEGLRRRGVRAGDRVALILPNCPQLVIAQFAVLRLGAVAVAHDPSLPAAEIAAHVAHYRPAVMIAVDERLPDLVGRAAGEGIDGQVNHAIAVAVADESSLARRAARVIPGSRRGHTSYATTWRQLLATDPIDRAHPRPVADDLAVLHYDRDAGGRPRGAMLTHRNLCANAQQLDAWMPGARPRAEVLHVAMPLSAPFGMTLYLAYGLRKQARLVLFESDDRGRAAQRPPATIQGASPARYRRAVEAGRRARLGRKVPTYALAPGTGLAEDVVTAWEARTGGLLVAGYGKPETTAVALANPFWPTRRDGTVGVPLPNTNMRVADPDDPTRTVAPGQPGELQVRGPQVFAGYWQDEAATAAAFTADGWLRTGDLATVDADGFVTVVTE